MATDGYHRLGSAPAGMEESVQGAQGSAPGESVIFVWNKRECKGNRLHEAVLAEDFDTVRRVLDQEPSTLRARFTYETRFQNTVQEGSGEAIHLAVSRGSTEVVSLLLERKAVLDAMVTRGGKGHYDVLHAAIFSEGRGGQKNICQCLLDAKAEHTRNLDGHYPLHKAYQTGVFDCIPILREDMHRYGLLESLENDLDSKIPTPLQVGIRTGKLTGEQLAMVASLTPASLKVFLRDDPRSIPSFVNRMAREGVVMQGSELASLVSVADLVNCLRTYAPAAAVLLDEMTQAPEVANPGWHPLPNRLDFGPRDYVGRLRDMCNPPRELICSYQPTVTWEFDAKDFKAPDWHDSLSGKFGGQVFDASIQVCALPEVINSELLGALQDASYDDIYGNQVIIAVLETIWWGGAYKLDLLQFFITLMALMLLIFERVMYEWHMIHDNVPADELVERRLHDYRNRHPPHHLPNATDPHHLHIWSPHMADEFIGARGFIDFVHEMAQFAGCIAIGRASDYFDIGNFYDLFRAGLGISFYWFEQNRPVQVLLILIQWSRLLEISFSESLMRELLPITQLSRGLAPSFTVFVIAILAFSHAAWVMDSSRNFWPATFYDSFSLLLTSALPELNPEAPMGSQSFTLLFAYFAISAFTIFFLNIFIGVIGEQYAREKEGVAISFQKKRCGHCYNLLVRATVIPCRVLSRRSIQCVYWSCAVMACAAMVLVVSNIEPFPGAFVLVFTVCQALTIFAVYQDPEETWSQPTRATQGHLPRYMWMARVQAREEEQDDPSAKAQEILETARGEMDTLRAELAELKALLLRDSALPAKAQPR